MIATIVLNTVFDHFALFDVMINRRATFKTNLSDCSCYMCDIKLIQDVKNFKEQIRFVKAYQFL